MTRAEMLTVGLLVGAIGISSVVAVSSARTRLRDTVRLSQVRDVQRGLEAYFTEHAAYPAATTPVALGQTTTACLTEDGFEAPCANNDNRTAYLELVPAPPTQGLKGDSSCSDIKDAYCYSSDQTSFQVQFELEKNYPLNGLQKGLNCVTEGEVSPGACPGY